MNKLKDGLITLALLGEIEIVLIKHLTLSTGSQPNTGLAPCEIAETCITSAKHGKRGKMAQNKFFDS